MKIFFRVDASNKIGTGHVMRCLTLASKLPAAEFITTNSDGNLIDVIRQKGFKVHALETGKTNESYCFHSHWLENAWQDDAAKTAKIVDGADLLVIDHYAIDKRWESVLRGKVKKIMVIDDLADREHDCDLLLDQNYFPNMNERYNGAYQKLIGPKYALLRDEFATAPKRDFAKVQNILVLFGGIDATNETGKVLDALKNKNYKVTAITGSFNLNNLESRFSCSKNIKLIERADNVASLMKIADLCIGACGATTWERAALALPSIVWPIAENQMNLVQALASYGAVKLSSPEKLEHDLENITQDELKNLSEKSHELCDGKGATRVVESISSLIG